MKVTVFYVGSSLLAPLKNAEREINRDYNLGLAIAAYNFGAPLHEYEWGEIHSNLKEAEVVFVIHVMDGENASRLLSALEQHPRPDQTVVVINCMPDLMRHTRMGGLDIDRLSRLVRETRRVVDKQTKVARDAEGRDSSQTLRVLANAAAWVGRQAHSRNASGDSKSGPQSRRHYLKLIDNLPRVLRFVPSVGTLGDAKNYLYLFAYFLQPSPSNIRLMILYALKHYVRDPRLRAVKVKPPQSQPAVAIYHPDAPKLFKSFQDYSHWYVKRAGKTKDGKVRAKTQKLHPDSSALHPDSTIGLLLMRPHVISQTTRHYDSLIHAIEEEGLSVIPAISTFMDNREACRKFFVETMDGQQETMDDRRWTIEDQTELSDEIIDGPSSMVHRLSSRVSQILSLTGFSFVGGPAMNDSEAATSFLRGLNRPYRSVVSLDTQTIEAWADSGSGLNPIQAGMQIAIPEIDGATEPFVFGGIPARGVEPVALEDRCRRLARRLKRWNRLRTAPRHELRLAVILFCFPPNKGNIGTAADLDVFESLIEMTKRLSADGYDVQIPDSAEDLRNKLLAGNADKFGTQINVAYRMSVDEYRQLCPYVSEIEKEWNVAPGRINTFANELLIHGISLGNVFVGVQPTFGYEGDPMRLMMARGSAPHHGFMAFYTYLTKILNVDAVVHLGTHGALEFMPGKQVGLSGECWPDRLINEVPNIYIYSVNNPSEGSIAKRRSYAELVSYLTAPIESAGLYKELATLKELLRSYRQTTDEFEREKLFAVIEESSDKLKLNA